MRIHFDWRCWRLRILLDPFSDESDLGFGILEAGRDGHDVVDEIGDDWGVVALVHGSVGLSNQGFQVLVRWAYSYRSRIFVVTLDDFCIGRRFSMKNKMNCVSLSLSHTHTHSHTVNNDHPWELLIVVVVDSGSLFRVHLCKKIQNWDLKMVVVMDKWSLFGVVR